MSLSAILQTQTIVKQFSVVFQAETLAVNTFFIYNDYVCVVVTILIGYYIT